MIARIWRGYTTPGNADAYQAMLEPELLPGLSRAPGYQGSCLMRRAAGDEVEFVTIIFWESLDAVRAIAGEDYERSVVPEPRRPLLSRYDEKAIHYDMPVVHRIGDPA